MLCIGILPKKFTPGAQIRSPQGGRPPANGEALVEFGAPVALRRFHFGRCSTIKTKFGVMGSAGGEFMPEIMAQAFRLGEQIASHECIVLTGACPGLPHQAVLGARKHGGLVVGISPALGLDEHRKRYLSPYQEYDIIIFTGSGLMGREITTIRSCDIVAIVGGRSGTLGEFAVAYDEGKVIAVLQATGGIADHLPEVLKVIDKETGAEIIYETDPAALVEKAVACHERRIAAGTAYLGPRTTI